MTAEPTRFSPRPLDADSLLRRYAYAPAGEVDAFWAQMAVRGTPLWSTPEGEDEADVTFVWRASAVEEHPDGMASVHVHVNRVTDKEHYDAGFMRHVPGTDIWVLTLSLSPTLRSCYGFTPLRRGEQPADGPPELCTYWTRRDPLSLCPPLADHGPYGLSVLAGPQAPDQTEWESAATLRGLHGGVIREPRPLPSDGRPRDHWLYLPPTALRNGREASRGADSRTPGLPLLTLFDAETWFGEMSLPQALENAMESGRIPEIAVLGISNAHRVDRIERLGANSAFLHDVAETGTTWAEERAAEHGIRFAGRHGRVVSGQSLGGLSALVAALEQPQAYGIALAHSSSLWWTPDGRSTPKNLIDQPEGGWITGRFAESEPQDVRIRLDVGTREGLTVPQTESLQRTLRERGWQTERTHLYDGGHDFAWWRGALIDGLEATLMEFKETSGD